MLVHDAARPLVTEEVIERVITGLADGWDGAVPCLPIADAVKRVDGETVVETLDREGPRHGADAAGFRRIGASRGPLRRDFATDCC